jgi:hypothetical protein
VECHDKSVDESDTDMLFRHVMTLSIYLVFSLCMEVYFFEVHLLLMLTSMLTTLSFAVQQAIAVP